MSQVQGWLPPPRPIYIAPTYDPSDSDEITRWKILLDWAHDDDLKDFITNQKILLWGFGGAAAVGGHFNNFPTDTLIAFYFLGANPTADVLADFATKYDLLLDFPPDPGDPGQVVLGKNVATRWPQAWLTIWQGLDDVLTNKVIPKRAALGMLPDNVFLDSSGNLAPTIVIHYYDDAWIKRISYPQGVLSAASQTDQWWNLSGVTMDQWATNSTDTLGSRSPAASNDPNADWYADGWDFAKGSGAFFDILHAIVTAIGLVLSATGVGAVLATFIIAVLSIALDLIQAEETAVMNGDAAVALLSIGQAILSVGTAELGQLSQAAPALAKLGKTGITALGALLSQVGTDLSPAHQSLSLSDQLDLLQQKAASYDVMTLDNFNAVLAFVSGNGSVTGMPLAQNGWDTSQYASRSDVAGVGAIYENYLTSPSAAVWKMGAQLGTLSKTQAAMGLQPVSPWARSTPLNKALTVLIPPPQVDLMNYVRYVLAPRYNIP